MKIVKNPIFLFFLFINFFIYLVFIVLAQPLYGAKQEKSGPTLSYPISYVVDLGKNKTILDRDLGFQINYPEVLTYKKYDRKINDEILRNIVSLTNTNDPNDSRFNLEIIPIETESENTALNTLESYIVRYVGIIPKNNQKTFKVNSFDVAQVGYNPFQGDGMNYFRVFTILKENNSAWIFTFGYLGDMSEKDSLNLEGKFYTKIFTQILDSFKSLNNPTNAHFNTIDTTKLTPEWINEYRNSNNKFETNL